MTRALLLGLVCCLLGSCASTVSSTPPASSPPVSASSAVSDGDVQSTLDALGGSVRDQDRPAFDQLMSLRDPDFAAVADRIYDNLATATLDSLTFRLRPQRQDLSQVRQALLGPAATARAVEVSWRLRGDSGPAAHLLWLTLLPQDGALTVAGTTDGPPGRVAQPFWLLERLRVDRAATTTVLAGSADVGTSRRDYAGIANAAVAALRVRLPADVRSRWNGDLVLEIPSTPAIFEQLLGVAPGSYAQIAAVAWPEGPDPATSALRIVLNPELAGQLDDDGLAIVVTHEATHIATRSAASAAPSWLVEGFADYVAYDAHPLTSGAAAAGALADVRAHGVPTALPADSVFSASAPELSLSYGRSWLACRFLAETYTPARLSRFYVAVDGGSSVDRASRSVFGLSQSQLTAAWGRYLRDLADQH